MTITEWIAAQGHWAYIIGSYAVGAVLLLAEVLLIRARHAKARAEAARPLDNESWSEARP